MPMGDICNREVVFAYKDTSILEAARLMRHHHVGDLVIVEEQAGQRRPVGLLTDRDIVVEIVAKEVDVTQFTAGDIMAADLLCAQEADGIFEILRRMRARGVRRVPVVNAQQHLVGIVSVDDLIDLFAEEMNDLSQIVAHEQQREANQRV